MTRRNITKAANGALTRATGIHGWGDEHLACDTAVEILAADGYDHTAAVNAVDAAWIKRTFISGPN